MNQHELAEMHAWTGARRLREPERSPYDLALQDLRSTIRKSIPLETYPVGSPQRLLVEIQHEELMREAKRLGYETPRQRLAGLALETAAHASLGL